MTEFLDVKTSFALKENFVFFCCSLISYISQNRIDTYQSNDPIIIKHKLFELWINVSFATVYLVKTIERPSVICSRFFQVTRYHSRRRIKTHSRLN